MHFINSVIALSIASFTTALPTTPAPRAVNTISPKVTSQYEVWTGAIYRTTEKGKIFKSGHTTDVTTLLTFEFPEDSRGKTCSFHFDLSADPTAKISGTGQFDVFTSIAPAAYSTKSWPPGNLRDQHIGRMAASAKGEATWVSGFPTFGQGFPCPAGETHAGELVGTGDVDHIEWLAANQVVTIQY